MSIQKPVLTQDARPVPTAQALTALDPSTLYFTAPAAPAASPDLRALTALEQMFGYFGTDLR